MKNLIIFITGLFYLIMSTPLFSQNDTINIEEIIVSKKNNEDILNMQTKISEINSFPPGTTGELFENVPGLNIIKRSGFSIEPALHMFKREQLNLMIDGGTKITQSCANRMDAMTTRISSNEIEKIELIKGPYSVRFGQSFGGVINIITKHTKRSEKLNFRGSTDIGYEFNGAGLSTGLELEASDKKFDILVNGTHRHFGDYKSGNDNIIISSFNAYDYSAKIGYNINSNNRIQASFRNSMAKDVMHAGLPMDALDDDGKLFSLDYKYQNQGKLLSEIRAKIYGSLVDHLMTNEFKVSSKFVDALAPVNSKTFGGKYELKFVLNKKLDMFAGLDYFYKTRDGYRNRNVKENSCSGIVFPEPKEFTDKIWQNSFTKDYGFFAELNYSVSEKLILKTGLRTDLIQSDILDPEADFDEFYGNDLNPEAQKSVDFFIKADFNLPKGVNILLASGKASRTPDLLELFINHSSVGQDSYEYLGSPNLKAEKNMQTDFVILKNAKKYSVYVNFFYSYIKDFISAKVDSTIARKFTPCMQPSFTKQFVNVDEIYQYGIDGGFKIELFNNLNFGTKVSYTFAHNITWDEPVAEISPLNLITEMAYSYKNFKFVIKNRYVANQNRIASSFGETETSSFDIVDFNVIYKPAKFISLGFGIDNIADVNYYEHTSRSYKNLIESSMFFEPGRNLKLVLKVDF